MTNQINVHESIENDSSHGQSLRYPDESSAAEDQYTLIHGIQLHLNILHDPLTLLHAVESRYPKELKRFREERVPELLRNDPEWARIASIPPWTPGSHFSLTRDTVSVIFSMFISEFVSFLWDIGIEPDFPPEFIEKLKHWQKRAQIRHMLVTTFVILDTIDSNNSDSAYHKFLNQNETLRKTISNMSKNPSSRTKESYLELLINLRSQLIDWLREQSPSSITGDKFDSIERLHYQIVEALSEIIISQLRANLSLQHLPKRKNAEKQLKNGLRPIVERLCTPLWLVENLNQIELIDAGAFTLENFTIEVGGTISKLLPTNVREARNLENAVQNLVLAGIPISLPADSLKNDAAQNFDSEKELFKAEFGPIREVLSILNEAINTATSNTIEGRKQKPKENDVPIVVAQKHDGELGQAILLSQGDLHRLAQMAIGYGDHELAQRLILNNQPEDLISIDELIGEFPEES